MSILQKIDLESLTKHSIDSVPGVTLDELVDRLTIPDVDHLEHFARTKTFLMIYRKFLRPRELLEMLIERFEELGEFATDDDERMIEIKNNSRDRERVALFPCLSDVYAELLPLSSIQYFQAWRWPQGDPTESRNSSFSGPTFNGLLSDDDSDSGFYDAAGAIISEQDMDEDREWGLFDEENTQPEAKMAFNIESLAPFPHSTGANAYGINSRFPTITATTATMSQLPRDRRSSTGSLAHSSACAMETFVASRRGSASSIHSGNQSAIHQTFFVPQASFPEGDLTPFQQQQQQQQQLHIQQPQPQHPQSHSSAFQPMISLPFIGKRSSSQAYRQKAQQQQNSMSPAPLPMPQGSIHNGSSISLIFKETTEDGSMHPLQGRSSPLPPPPIDYLSVNTPFIEIKDGAIAAQLTCVEFGLFRKLKPRDMLRQVWKTKRGSTAFQACIAHFNFISSWVGTMILSPPKAKNRAKMMEKFINIAKILRDMGNFNTTMAIIGAMNTSPIHRLVQTREHLQGKEVWATFKELEHLMSSERSFYEYRQALKAQKQPCIPYLGVHLGDLLSISEGNRDFRQDGTIHWQKFCLLTDVISNVMHYQSEPYVIQPDPFISRVITDTHVLDDEEMYSKSVEPSVTTTESELVMVDLRKRTNGSNDLANGNDLTNGNDYSNGKISNGDDISVPNLSLGSNNSPPPMYKAIRFFFKICLHSFYGHVEVEGTENIAPDNYPAILVANHSNSLTDAIAIMSTVPSKSRSMVRLTAKDTFWHKPGVFNYIIKSAGTIPIKRRKDHDNQKVDNTESMNVLIDSLGTGSCV
ncbi:hypothetical protein BGZ46_009370, partial [Entomortierella lignicola]